MEHKEAAAVLIKMIEKGTLAPEEKEALLVAVGMLSWSQLAQSRLKARKAKREKAADGK